MLAGNVRPQQTAHSVHCALPGVSLEADNLRKQLTGRRSAVRSDRQKYARKSPSCFENFVFLIVPMDRKPHYLIASKGTSVW